MNEQKRKTAKKRQRKSWKMFILPSLRNFPVSSSSRAAARQETTRKWKFDGNFSFFSRDFPDLTMFLFISSWIMASLIEFSETDFYDLRRTLLCESLIKDAFFAFTLRKFDKAVIGVEFCDIFQFEIWKLRWFLETFAQNLSRWNFLLHARFFGGNKERRKHTPFSHSDAHIETKNLVLRRRFFFTLLYPCCSIRGESGVSWIHRKKK